MQPNRPQSPHRVTRCEFHYFEKPVPHDIEDIENTQLEVFFALAIVNPFGPTLNLLASVGAGKMGVSAPLVHVMLNPFAQSVEQIGTFTPGAQWIPEKDFIPRMDRDFGACPTLVLLGDVLDEGARKVIGIRLLQGFDDKGKTFSLVEKHYGDPWSRVSEEIAEAFKPCVDKSGDASAEDLLELLLAPEHVWSEIRAFNYAWKGSIEDSGIPEEMKADAFSYKRFQDLFAQFVLPRVWLPEQPENEPPARSPVTEYVPENLAEVREKLHDEGFCGDLEGDELLSFLVWAMLLYGHRRYKPQ